jgi:hypothetical protein
LHDDSHCLISSGTGPCAWSAGGIRKQQRASRQVSISALQLRKCQQCLSPDSQQKSSCHCVVIIHIVDTCCCVNHLSDGLVMSQMSEEQIEGLRLMVASVKTAYKIAGAEEATTTLAALGTISCMIECNFTFRHGLTCVRCSGWIAKLPAGCQPCRSR